MDQYPRRNLAMEAVYALALPEKAHKGLEKKPLNSPLRGDGVNLFTKQVDRMETPRKPVKVTQPLPSPPITPARYKPNTSASSSVTPSPPKLSGTPISPSITLLLSQPEPFPVTPLPSKLAIPISPPITPPRPNHRVPLPISTPVSPHQKCLLSTSASGDPYRTPATLTSRSSSVSATPSLAKSGYLQCHAITKVGMRCSRTVKPPVTRTGRDPMPAISYCWQHKSIAHGSNEPTCKVQCHAITKTGSRCSRTVKPPLTHTGQSSMHAIYYCWQHTPTEHGLGDSTDKVQCHATTKAGRRCLRTVKLPLTQTGQDLMPAVYCWQHKPIEHGLNNSTYKVRCQATTEAGTQCSRTVKPPLTHAGQDPVPAIHYCWQHLPIVHPQPGFYVDKDGCADQYMQFESYIPTNLKLHTQQALETDITKSLPTADDPSFLYAFEVSDSDSPDLIQFKVNRAVNVKKCLDEWNKQCTSGHIQKGWWPDISDGANSGSAEDNTITGEPGLLSHRVERPVYLELKDLSLYSASYFDPDQSMSTTSSALSSEPRTTDYRCKKDVFSFHRPENGKYKRRGWDHDFVFYPLPGWLSVLLLFVIAELMMDA
ncbi:hypothetical protein V8B97DRAFT_1946542 [Scleroderma yunnanense]